MIPFQERQKFRKIMYSKVSLVVLFVVLIAVGKGSWDIHQKSVIAETERGITERSLLDLESRTRELEVSLTRLKSDQGIEAEIRQKYMVARPGEDVVVVVDDTTKKGKIGDAPNPKSILEQILSLVGAWF